MELKGTRVLDDLIASYETEFQEINARMIILYGGSRAGKTWALLQFFVFLMATNIRWRITVWRNERSVCKNTVMKDFENILLSDTDLFDSFLEQRSKNTFVFKLTGSSITFEGADSIGKVLGMTQDISFFNEVTEFNEAVFLQITQRTAKFVFTDYNPSKSFWLEKMMHKEDTLLKHYTYLDNAFCPPNIVKQLNGYNPNIPENVENGTADDYMYQVYCLGKKAEKPGRVYKEWEVISGDDYDALPYENLFGLDFGLNSPTALVRMKFDGDYRLYVDELLYKPIVTMNKGLVEEFATIDELPLGSEIIADSKNTDYIAELNRAGYLVIGAIKGAGSIGKGIADIQRLKVYMTKRSENIAIENENYSWKLDRYGIPTDETNPVDDHCLKGDTLIKTREGYKPIKDIKVGESVYTRAGYNKVEWSGVTGTKVINKYTFWINAYSYLTIFATDNHLIKTDEGWKEISKVKQGQKVYLDKNSMERFITNIEDNATSQSTSSNYTEKYGSSIMEKYLKECTYTTLMETLQTMRLKISNVLHLVNTHKSMKKLRQMYKGRNEKKTLTSKDILLLHGINQKKENNGIENTQKVKDSDISESLESVKNVEKNLLLRNITIDSAQTIASQKQEESQELTMNEEYARIVERNLQSTNILRQDSVQEVVVTKVEVDYGKREEVYNLHIENVPEYIANGMLVHNCMDAIRYRIVPKLAELGL